MDLIIDQMMELEVIRIADRDKVVERLAGAAVIQDRLAVLAEACQLQSLADVLLVAPSKIGVATFQPRAWAA